jgi:isoleucyl-tRNA synthetase
MLRALKETLVLPQTRFPAYVRDAFAHEAAVRGTHSPDALYAWQTSSRAARPRFVLHDGPPFANGQLHVGHALNKVSLGYAVGRVL